MRSRLRSTAFLAVLTLAALPLASAQQVTGKVVGVTDGDTIEVLIDGKAEKVRLYGIDTPEKTQAFGTKAKQFTSAAAFGKTVAVNVKDRDRYGRLVGEVTLPDTTSLNQRLVQVGLAWWYQQYAPKDAALRRLQNEAMTAKRGLWADIKPIPPWEFRKGKTTVGGASATANIKPLGATQITAAVYATNSGTKYHRDGCRYLSKSKIPVSLSAAQGQGLTACKVCKP